MYVCIYVCIREFISRRSYSLSSHECAPYAKPKRCVFSLLQKSASVNVGSRSDGGREFHSFGAQAVKLRGPKLVVRQASTCRSPRAAKPRWRWLVLSVTGGTAERFDGDTCRWSRRAWTLSSLELAVSEDHLKLSV